MLKWVLFVLCAVLLGTQNSFAGIYAPPPSFEAAVGSTDVIAIAQVKEGDVPNLFEFGRNEKLSKPIILSIQKAVKGNASGDVRVDVSSINPDLYRDLWFSIKKEDNVLVLLTSDKGTLKLRPNCLSLIPLSSEAVPLVNENLTSEQNIERLLAKGSEEDSLRRLSVFLLSQFHTTSAMYSVARYVNDKDDYVADYALSSCARNEQVAAIPIIVTRSASFTFGGTSVPLISEYHVKEAKPFLEKAMFGYPSGIRLNSLVALSNMANKDSVPFLLLSLYDQDPQKFVAPYSCALLHKILSDIPNNFDVSQYEKQKTRERQLFFSWWSDELTDKNPHAGDDKDRIVLTEGEAHDVKDVPKLNEALFMQSKKTRLAAIQFLDKLADQSSVPYLLVALHDPQRDVAFGAHRILVKLVSNLGPLTPSNEFNAKQEQIAEAGAQWWSTHLQDMEEARWQGYRRQLDEQQRQMMEETKTGK